MKVDLSNLKTYSPEETASHPQNEHTDYVGRGKYVITFSSYSYMNHSCNPNILVKHETIARSKFYAIRDIKKGEQLTYDYGVNGMDCVGKRLLPDMICKCGSRNCRKRIPCDFFEQPIEIQRKYYKYLPPSIRRKYKNKFKKLRKKK